MFNVSGLRLDSTRVGIIIAVGFSLFIFLLLLSERFRAPNTGMLYSGNVHQADHTATGHMYLDPLSVVLHAHCLVRLVP